MCRPSYRRNFSNRAQVSFLVLDLVEGSIQNDVILQLPSLHLFCEPFDAL